MVAPSASRQTNNNIAKVAHSSSKHSKQPKLLTNISGWLSIEERCWAMGILTHARHHPGAVSTEKKQLAKAGARLVFDFLFPKPFIFSLRTSRPTGGHVLCACMLIFSPDHSTTFFYQRGTGPRYTTKAGFLWNSRMPSGYGRRHAASTGPILFYFRPLLGPAQAYI